MQCPKCSTECHRDEADVGVGIIYGPYGCPGCGWSEDPHYDRTARNPVDANGGVTDQFGGYHPPGSEGARAYFDRCEDEWMRWEASQNRPEQPYPQQYQRGEP